MSMARSHGVRNGVNVSVSEKSYYVLRRERLTESGLCIECGNRPRKKTARRCVVCTGKMTRAHHRSIGRAVPLRRHEQATDGMMTFTEIGNALGISRSRAEQICYRALHKLQRECERVGLDAGDIMGKGFSMIANCERWA